MTGTETAALVTAFLAAPLWQLSVKAWERVNLKRAATDADAHAECREEVSELRGRVDDHSTEVATLRSSIQSCETKHAASEQRVSALETLVQILMREVRGRDTTPPEPAE